MASDFGKAVADELRGLKEGIAGRPSSDPAEKGYIDRSVRETINHDLDTLIEKHDKQKPFPSTI
jgi:hypothetical protein